MDSNDFAKFGHAKAATLARYLTTEAPLEVTRVTLRFIDDNFRLQGWQGATFQKWDAIKRDGTILVLSGTLRRSFNFDVRPGGEIYFYNNVLYAQVHNEGFKGQINVKPFNRSTYAKVKVGNISTRKMSTVTVKTNTKAINGFVRNANIKQRQFAPYEGHESPVMNNAIIAVIEPPILKILNA